MNIDMNIEIDLENACTIGNLPKVKKLVEEGRNLHAGWEEPLRCACRSGHLEVVRYLVEKGADIHIDGDAPLRTACVNCRLQIVKYLVENGANIHVGYEFLTNLGILNKDKHYEAITYLRNRIIREKLLEI